MRDEREANESVNAKTRMKPSCNGFESLLVHSNELCSWCSASNVRLQVKQARLSTIGPVEQQAMVSCLSVLAKKFVQSSTLRTVRWEDKTEVRTG